MFAEAVVLPTPPFPDVITITRPLILFTRFAFAVTQLNCLGATENLIGG
jgi:hypothetical protein